MVREGRLTDEEIREDAEITEFWRKITEVAFAEQASAFPEKASARTEEHAVTTSGSRMDGSKTPSSVTRSYSHSWSER